jgi:hypothetical protein
MQSRLALDGLIAAYYLTLRQEAEAREIPQGAEIYSRDRRKVTTAKGDTVMKRVSISFLISFFLCIPILYGQEQADAPEYKNEDVWVFRSNIGGRNPVRSSSDAIGDYELMYSGGKVGVRKIEGEQKTATTDSVGIIRAMLASEGALHLLQFPIAIGKQWSSQHQTNVRGAPVPVRGLAEVSNIEEIGTPAGKFRAFRIERSESAGALKWKRVYYYSPETKSIVKYHFESATGHEQDIELIKFTPGR